MSVNQLVRVNHSLNSVLCLKERIKKSYVSKFQSSNGGIKTSVDKEAYFFLGIIDTLTQWDIQKRGEQVVKTVVFSHDSNQISAVPPKQYCSRFLDYVDKIIAEPSLTI